MKSVSVKKVGAIAAGAAMIGAAFAAPISAQDIGGADMGFFYDDNYNPLVKIVVGQDAAASDGVAAANLAATIGNNAYKSATIAGGNQTDEVTCPVVTGDPAVVLSHRAKGAIGVYEQDEYQDDYDGQGDQDVLGPDQKGLPQVELLLLLIQFFLVPISLGGLSGCPSHHFLPLRRRFVP